MKSKPIFRIFTLMLLSLSFFGCQETMDGGPYQGAPKQIITIARAQEMYDNYSMRRVPIIQKYEDSISSNSSKFLPTRYAEYDLETIKQYIAFIEQESKQANVNVNTLRFYLSDYPDSDKFPNGDDVKYPRQNSFFIVPTTDFKGENAGFYIEEMDGKYTAEPISKQANIPRDKQDKTGSEPSAKAYKAGFFTSSTAAQKAGTTSLILNDGNICPPPSSGSNDFGNNN